MKFSQSSTVSRERINLNQIAQDVLLWMRPLSKYIPVDLIIDSNEIILSVDRIQISQVLVNLLKNAIEATELLPSDQQKNVELKIFINGNEAVCEVTNYHSYISPNDISELFHPFVSSKKGNTGIGLSIVKQIVEMHQGSIDVKSDQEKTVFTVKLPLYSQSN